jgi:thiamine kinase-like enzyme
MQQITEVKRELTNEEVMEMLETAAKSNGMTIAELKAVKKTTPATTTPTSYKGNKGIKRPHTGGASTSKSKSKKSKIDQDEEPKSKEEILEEMRKLMMHIEALPVVEDE